MDDEELLGKSARLADNIVDFVSDIPRFDREMYEDGTAMERTKEARNEFDKQFQQDLQLLMVEFEKRGLDVEEFRFLAEHPTNPLGMKEVSTRLRRLASQAVAQSDSDQRTG